MEGAMGGEEVIREAVGAQGDCGVIVGAIGSGRSDI